MTAIESFDANPRGRPPHLESLTSIPDLTNKIIRSRDQYCEAGGFGDVFRCRYPSDDGVKEVAVKAFRFSFSVDENKHDEAKAARMIRRELGIWRRLNHRNIVPFLGIVYGFGRKGSASLVSLWMPHGTLHTFLDEHGDRLAITHRLQLLLDIANGLHYLHSFPVIHGDLTSTNVLLDHNYNACLTDFGCATLVGELPRGLTYLKTSTMRPGTLRWAAPELFALDEGESRYTIKNDIYSFGNMAFLVLSGKYPWSEVQADVAVILRLSQGLKPARPLARPIDDQHWMLIERCWSPISDRPLTEDVVSSLQQLLSSYPPSQPFHDLFDVVASSRLFCPRRWNDDLEDDAISQGGIANELGEAIWGHHQFDTDDHTGKPSCEHPETGYSCNSSEQLKPSDGPPTITKWVRGELLGHGTYGGVYLALNMSNGEVFAVKQVEKGDKDNLSFVSELKMERDMLSRLHRPHIVGYLGFEETSTSLSLFLEYIPGGTIASRLREYGRFKEEVTKSFTNQIFDGLAYLHVNNIIHRNIEAGNILIDLSGICKLSGFGNAQHADDDHASWTPMRGAVFWTAPEVTRSGGGKRYGSKIDIWSAGCVLLKMWMGKRLLRDEALIPLVVKATSGGISPPVPSDVILSDLAVDFKDRCFAIDPEARASATELLQHPYLTLDPNWVFTGFK